jgi:hypothetical protein
MKALICPNGTGQINLSMNQGEAQLLASACQAGSLVVEENDYRVWLESLALTLKQAHEQVAIDNAEVNAPRVYHGMPVDENGEWFDPDEWEDPHFD